MYPSTTGRTEEEATTREEEWKKIEILKKKRKWTIAGRIVALKLTRETAVVIITLSLLWTHNRALKNTVSTICLHMSVAVEAVPLIFFAAFHIVHLTREKKNQLYLKSFSLYLHQMQTKFFKIKISEVYIWTRSWLSWT